jgi:ankyrin repeat protein
MHTIHWSLALTVALALTATDARADANEDMHAAALTCDTAGVQAAIDAGADPNALNAYDQNPLAGAFFCPETTTALLAAGSDPNIGYPAIIQAANNYSIETLKLLLDAGADPNLAGTIDPSKHLRVLADNERAKGKKANKAMIDAWEKAAATMPPSQLNAMTQTVQQTNCVPCLELLLAAGGKPEGVDGDSLMHRLAAFSQTAAMRKEGFSKGAEGMASFGLKVPEWYGNLGDDRNGSPGQMLDLLVKAGLDPNEKRADGTSAFGVAMRLHKLDLSKAMLRNGADAKSETQVEFGKRQISTWPVAQAAEFADKELMTMVLEQEPDVNVSVETVALGITSKPEFAGGVTWGGDGYTPLIIALMNDLPDVANMLLDAGAGVQKGANGMGLLSSPFKMLMCITDTKNKTPIYWAVEKRDEALVLRIAEKMAWKFNKDFKLKIAGGVSAFPGMACPKIKAKLSPSIYAMLVGNASASKVLSAKGL